MNKQKIKNKNKEQINKNKNKTKTNKKRLLKQTNKHVNSSWILSALSLLVEKVKFGFFEFQVNPSLAQKNKINKKKSSKSEFGKKERNEKRFA